MPSDAPSGPLNTFPAVRRFHPASDPAIFDQIQRESPEAAQWAPESYATLAGSGLGHILVSETPTEVVGFLCARRVADEAEILNLAVRPGFRRQGAGSQLVHEMIERLSGCRVKRVFLEVRESNAGAIAFYQKHGFLRTGRRRSYYHDPVEDALVFQRLLTD